MMKTNRQIVTSLTLLLGMLFTTACEAHQPEAELPQKNEKEIKAPTAQEWNREVTIGWNLGNSFECSAPGMNGESLLIGNPAGADNAETSWGNPVVSKKLIDAVKAAGFDAIRIPVRWQCHITNAQAMTISRTWMNRIKEIVDYCLKCDMKVIINTHHEKWLESRPTYKYKEENCQKLALLWMNIASEFKDYDYRLAFAGTNEVHERDNWGQPTAENLEVQNAYNQTFVDIVRATGGNNAQRHLMVQTYVCNPEFGLNNGDFIIPTDLEENGNRYMSVEFHYYQPWDYCGLGKLEYWGERYRAHGTAAPENEQTIIDTFTKVQQTWAFKGLGVVIGEWGVTDHYKSSSADLMRENMAYYCQIYVAEAKKRGFATFIWDNNHFGNGAECFGIIDRTHGLQIKAPWVMEGIKAGLKAVE